jgi:hypothetical protein
MQKAHEYLNMFVVKKIRFLKQITTANILYNAEGHLIMTNFTVCYRMNTIICTCMNIIYQVNGSNDSKFNLKCPHTNNGETNARAQCHLRCVQGVKVNMQ